MHLSTMGRHFSKGSTLTWAGYLVKEVWEMLVQPESQVRDGEVSNATLMTL